MKKESIKQQIVKKYFSAQADGETDVIVYLTIAELCALLNETMVTSWEYLSILKVLNGSESENVFLENCQIKKRKSINSIEINLSD